MDKITLLIHCRDKTGIIAAVTRFFAEANLNIIYIDQYVDNTNNEFFMRLECELHDGYPVTAMQKGFQDDIAAQFDMLWEMFSSSHRPRMAVFVSKYEHCLFDILARHSGGELNVDIPLIISNHNNLHTIAERFGIPYYHIPVTADTKAEAEARQVALLKEHNVDFIVLARYMQIVSGNLINLYHNKIINIHHSFLPAFPGAKPYHSAFERGVKIIGATSHYVTEMLDEGPIIDQDTIRVSHIHSIDDFILKGRDLERNVLSRAIKLHAERKTMVYGNKTVIFS
ncbi:MAG: formyltetrahydrofolate deformylase [Flavobacterium sp.]